MALFPAYLVGKVLVSPTNPFEMSLRGLSCIEEHKNMCPVALGTFIC